MIVVWVFIIVAMITVLTIYFELTEPIMSMMTSMETAGAPEWVVDWTMRCYHGAFIILIAGIVLYGILVSQMKEYDTYQ